MAIRFDEFSTVTWEEFGRKHPDMTYALLKWNDDLEVPFCLHDLYGKNIAAIIEMWKKTVE